MKWHRGFFDYIPGTKRAYLCTGNDEIVVEVRKVGGYWRKVAFSEMRFTHPNSRSFHDEKYTSLKGCKKQYEEDYDFHILKNGK